MVVRLVTDSACDLPAALCAELGIGVVPIYLTYGDRSLRDGTDIDAAAVLGRLAGGDFPRFSQPSPADFGETFRCLARSTVPHHRRVARSCRC